MESYELNVHFKFLQPSEMFSGIKKINIDTTTNEKFSNAITQYRCIYQFQNEEYYNKIKVKT